MTFHKFPRLFVHALRLVLIKSNTILGSRKFYGCVSLCQDDGADECLSTPPIALERYDERRRSCLPWCGLSWTFQGVHFLKYMTEDSFFGLNYFGSLWFALLYLTTVPRQGPFVGRHGSWFFLFRWCNRTDRFTHDCNCPFLSRVVPFQRAFKFEISSRTMCRRNDPRTTTSFVETFSQQLQTTPSASARFLPHLTHHDVDPVL